jgi:hypothetical protein
VNEANVLYWTGINYMLYERVGSEEVMIDIINKIGNNLRLSIRQGLYQSHLDFSKDEKEAHVSLTGISLLISIQQGLYGVLKHLLSV